MNNNKICYIIGAGEFYPNGLAPGPGDLIIAADGGYAHLQGCGIEPDIVIGDFDSLPEQPVHPNIIKLNKEKDCTDTFAALNAGLREGHNVFHIYGGTGGRADHTHANIQSLVYLARNGARGLLFGKDYIITAIRNTTVYFDSGYNGYISVFAHSGAAKGVYLKGLKYELENAELSDAVPLGVSNEFTGVESSVTVKDGTLVIIFPINPT